MNSAAPIARALATTFGGHWSVQRMQASGFCATWHAHQPGLALFVKSLPLAQRAALDAEADGLLALAAGDAIRVPEVVQCWSDEDTGQAVLAMEWLDLFAPDDDFGARFGTALGRLHAAHPEEGGGRFGWRRDNRIGATPQPNAWSEDGSGAAWIDFFRARRLQPMRDRVLSHRHATELAAAVDRVIEHLPALFADGAVPRASLIHGDLWSGNWGMLSDGTPVVYDPAVSCSDAEAELAMMELFGQPPSGFWRAYTGVYALHEGYARRRALYQLYHLLNHAVLFGGGYIGQASEVARRMASGA
jgi:fructosamine-3-kinase